MTLMHNDPEYFTVFLCTLHRSYFVKISHCKSAMELISVQSLKVVILLGNYPLLWG